MAQTTLRCTALNDTAEGIALYEGKPLRIAGLLEGESAVVELMSGNQGTLVRLLETSKDRVKPPCPYFYACGGCSLQHLAYPAQLDWKTRKVRQQLERFGLDSSVVLPAIGLKDPYFYRTKVQMAFSEKGPKVMAGFYEENTHRIVNVDRCLIQDDIANNIVRTAKQLMMKHKIKPFDEDKGTGLVRHIMIKRSEATSQVLVILVTQEEMFPGRNNFVSDLKKEHPEITSIVQNVNDRKTSIVLGDFERVLFGKGTIEDVIFEKRFLIGSKTFYQVNQKQTQVLYQKALELAKPKAEDVVLDAYAGVGTIGILFADHVRKVIAVEINPASVTNAILNARLNNAKNIRFYKEDTIKFMEQLVAEQTVVDIVVFDPPRAGLEAGFVDALAKLKPKKIVYVSCDPGTLARDLRLIVDQGYELKRVQPVDMFCQTFHVETVSLLSLK
jgi:23S rRNA (uracil1939-C5)-methyltransferase